MNQNNDSKPDSDGNGVSFPRLLLVFKDSAAHAHITIAQSLASRLRQSRAASRAGEHDELFQLLKTQFVAFQVLRPLSKGVHVNAHHVLGQC